MPCGCGGLPPRGARSGVHVATPGLFSPGARNAALRLGRTVQPAGFVQAKLVILSLHQDDYPINSPRIVPRGPRAWLLKRNRGLLSSRPRARPRRSGNSPRARINPTETSAALFVRVKQGCGQHLVERPAGTARLDLPNIPPNFGVLPSMALK